MEYLASALITLIVWYLYNQRRPNNFPPGPRFGYPLLGHIPLLGIEGHKTVLQWRPKYGPIIGVTFGNQRVVIISDSKLVREAASKDAFSGRPSPFLRPSIKSKVEGIAFTEGKKWQEQRRFAFRRLFDQDFDSKTMESIVHDNILELIERLKENIEVPISTSGWFNVAFVNSLWTAIAGQRFKQDDPELREIIKMATENIGGRSFRRLIELATLGLKKYLPNALSKYIQPKLIEKRPTEVLTPYIDAHFKEHDPENPRDFIDAYINEMKSKTDPGSSFRIDNKKALIFTILDLIIAGTDTMSTTLTWIFLYLARQKHVQEKLGEEIEKIVGHSRLPSLTDRPSMPYTEAVIHEVMRSTTLVPWALPHATTKDVEFHGFKIPKGTTVLFNLYEINHNIEVWGDPENFRPERFLSKDGTKFERREGFVSFSLGKRGCPGEILARDQLFLFTTSLFQVFHVTWDPVSPPPDYSSNRPGFLSPKPHKLMFTLRNS